MSQVAIIGGGGVVLMLLSLSAAASVATMLMGGDDKPVTPTPTPTPTDPTPATATPTDPTPATATPTDPTPSDPPPPPPPKYTEFPGYDFTGNDIECSTTEADACQAKCDANDKCVSYIHISDNNGCCTKYGTPNYTYLPDVQITGFIKNIDGYEVEEVGDRPAGDIEHMRPATISQCKTKCDSLTNCIGFNFRKDMCWIKKADGISPTYVNNGFQFYTKK